MGVYVYTARATGRIPAWIHGGYHQIFPMKYEYKIGMFTNNTDASMHRAIRNAERTEKRDDWTGYVSYAGCVYKVDSAYWVDSTKLGDYCGEIYAGPMGAEVR